MIGFAVIVWALIGYEVLINFGMYAAKHGTRRYCIWFLILCGPAVWLLKLLHYLLECFYEWRRRQ